MATITYIYQKLQRSRNTSGDYTLRKEVDDSPVLQAFFVAIGTNELIIRNAIVTPAVPSTEVTIEGKGKIPGSILNFPEAVIGIVINFRMVDDALHIAMSITPPPTTSLRMNGFWLTLTNVVGSLSITGKYSLSDWKIEGTLSNRNNLRVRLTKISADNWEAELITTDTADITPESFINTLFDQATFGTDNALPSLSSFFPSELDRILNGLKISRLYSHFNQKESTVYFFETGLEVEPSKIWELIPGKFKISNIALGIQVINPLSATTRQLIGQIQGEVDIFNNIKAQVTLSGSSDLWSMEMLPAATGGITIPSIDHIFKMMGVDTGKFPDAIQKLPGLSLEYFGLEFSPKDRSLRRFSTQISTASTWEIIPDYLTLSRLSIDVTLEKDFKWKFVSGGISALWKVNSIEIALGAVAEEGNVWTFTGALLRPVSFTDLLKNQLQLPNGFPSIILSQANISCTPSTKNFHLDGFMEVTAAHEQALDLPLRTTRIGATLDVSQRNNAMVFDGKLHLEFLIGTNKVILDASLDNTSGEASLDFKGSVESPIAISSLVDMIKQRFSVPTINIPAPIESLLLSNLHIEFNTGTKNFKFTGDADFDINGQKLNIKTTIQASKQNQTYNISFSSVLHVGSLELNVIFSSNSAHKFFIAEYLPVDASKPLDITLETILKPLFGENMSRTIGLSGTKIDLKQLLIAVDKNADSSTKILLQVDTALVADFRNLPLIGHTVPDNTAVKIDNVGLIFTNQNWSALMVRDMNALLPAASRRLPEVDINTRFKPTVTGVTLNLSALKLDNPEVANAFLTSKTAADQVPSGQLPQTINGKNPLTTSPGKWFSVNKKVGIATLKRIGIVPQQKTIFLLLDASVEVSGLTFETDGLGIGFDVLHNFAVSFHLNGLGMDFKRGDIEIGGAFLHNQITLPLCNKTVDQYAGGAIIKMPKITLSALGAYSKTCDGNTSLFIFAALNAPIVGLPGIIMLNGIALAFGYNRKLIVPGIDDVATFPLVAMAVAGETNLNLTDTLQRVNAFIPISSGNYFFGAGIKFTIFNLLDSFAFLAVSFGDKTRVDVLGLTTLLVPPQSNSTPIAEIQMEIKATILPDEGFVGIEAQLTAASFIFSHSCHITGGFAFYSWLKGEHSGDFVVTMGGYHPQYNVPAHYPKVPRLGFNWNVTSDLSVKGGLYFALTPVAFMAGGFLDAIYHSGGISAWFRAGADFLISWKPYHYDAHLYIDMGGSLNLGLFSITIQVGADLHIWGPEFSGTATIHLWVLSFTVSFGDSRATPAPIEWLEFQKSFLPTAADAVDTNKYVNIGVSKGLSKQITFENEPCWVINPKDLELGIHSVIPIKRATYANSVSISFSNVNTEFGIAPMQLTPQDVDSSMQIVIEYKSGTQWLDQSNRFTFSVNKENVPAALWGKKMIPSIADNTHVNDVAKGITILPASKPIETGNHSISATTFSQTMIIPKSEQIQYIQPTSNFNMVNINGIELVTIRPNLTLAQTLNPSLASQITPEFTLTPFDYLGIA